ncbi:MAG: sulfatase-like hydrolase/transferase [Bryobacterales bacterium]|nr:sulfatase-like hydrolase/transferase [Bryobacterales bacterium]
MKSCPLACLALLAWSGCSSVPEHVKPNFVVILADDLGYGDIAAYGSVRNTTPHLDRMAREGLRFSDFHSNGPMCTPTRASLLTGLYPQRFGQQFESALSGIEDYDIGLPHEAVTIPETLASAGYVSGTYGKWHLGYHPPYMPLDQGFDEFRGLASGDGDHHSHIDRSGRPDWWLNQELVPEEGYGVDLITQHSIDFIKRHRDGPFFLYVAHLAIHFPWQGPDDRAYRVEGGNYHNLSKLGELDSLDVSSYVNKMIEAVDGSVGSILETLREQGLEENTLVIFTSDNGGYLTYQGGYHNVSENGPLRGQKTDVYEGGQRVPAIAWWPGTIAPGVSHDLAATFDIMPTLLELAGVASPHALDGVSLTRLLVDQEPLPSRTLFWRIRSETAVRKGKWKFVQIGNNPSELYDLEEDLGESQDLSDVRPDTVQALEQELSVWTAAVRAED